MAVFKCKLCGGTIEISENGIGICDSCGTKQTIPNTNDEKKMNLLDRANHFRMQNDFDKALAIYEQVLDEDATDSDVYYSIALCRYGITYVDDPKTKKKVPTINRMQNKSFLEDADFLMAIKNANPEQAKFYDEEGQYIDKVQQSILDITKKEKPYDVFICYKETDENGNRTYDSVYANDLYDGLTKEGFKVFFARITLEDKLGTAYEPYIFSALNSSKVMVVIGTKKEYMNAAWVKNEWSRFLSLIGEGKEKVLIPAYKDMDPYDLPDEFANLQAQDMSKLGFMQDLIRGIKKILGGKNEIKDSLSNNNQVNSLLKRVKLFLEDGDFDKATEYCEKALDIDAENSEAYFYKLLSEMKCRNEMQLKNINSIIIDSTNYKNAIKYGNEKLIKELTDIKNENIYYNSNIFFENNKYRKAKQMFSLIEEYEDSKIKINECNERIFIIATELFNRKQYNKAIKLLNIINDYKYSNEKKNEIQTEKIYNLAITLFKLKRYEQAANEFNKIINFKDSKIRYEEASKKNEMHNNLNKIKKNILPLSFIISPLFYFCFFVKMKYPQVLLRLYFPFFTDEYVSIPVKIFINSNKTENFPYYVPLLVCIISWLILPMTVLLVNRISEGYVRSRRYLTDEVIDDFVNERYVENIEPIKNETSIIDKYKNKLEKGREMVEISKQKLEEWKQKLEEQKQKFEEK